MATFEIIEISIEHIVINPNQPRSVFSEEAIRELADSIQTHGLIQPIVVRKLSDEAYELVAGERRLRAFKTLNKLKIPAIIHDMDIKDSAVVALIENVQRENLNYVEEALGYKKLMDNYSITQKELSQIVGKSQSTIANKCRILKFDEVAINMLLHSDLTERHARALLKIKDHPELEKHIQVVMDKELNVSKTEKYVKDLKSGKLDKEKEEEKSGTIKRYLKDIRLFTNTIKQAVEMVNESGVDASYKVREEEDKYLITIEIPMTEEK